jgi:hypothetical protein
MVSTALSLVCIMLINSGSVVVADPCDAYSLLSTNDETVAHHDQEGILIEKYDSTNTVQQKRDRLDALALFLKANSSFRAYIIAYGGRQSCRGEALLRAKLAKNYLTDVNGIDGHRLITLDGGYLDEWSIELWVGPPNTSRPTLMPSVNPRQVRISKKCKLDCKELKRS